MIQTIIKKFAKTKKAIEKRFSSKARFGRKNKDISIVSNNCIAGLLCRDLYIPNNSPTVGLQFTQAGFVEFCRNFYDYIQLPITEHPNPHLLDNEFRSLGGEKIEFPVGRLGDLVIFLQHYANVDEAAIAWERRKKRINSSKLFFIFMAYDNTEASIISDFNNLPINNSLSITINRNESTLGAPLLCGNSPWYSLDSVSGKPYYWKFDYINWFRECLKRQSAEQNSPPGDNSAKFHRHR